MKKLLLFFFLFPAILFSQEIKKFDAGGNYSLFYSNQGTEENWSTVNFLTSKHGNLFTVNAKFLEVPFSVQEKEYLYHNDLHLFHLVSKDKEYGIVITKDFANVVFVDIAQVDSPFFKPIVLTKVDTTVKKKSEFNIDSLLPLLKLFL